MIFDKNFNGKFSSTFKFVHTSGSDKEYENYGVEINGSLENVKERIGVK
jgi:hypothetical protein